jgi:hypothetical protein
MKLEIGKRYVRRDGKITGALRVSSVAFDSLYCPLTGDIYRYSNGRTWYNNISPFDLIEEYKPNTNEMKEKVEVSKQFLLDGHDAACSEWKERIEKEVPDLFEKDLKVGEWYWMDELNSLFGTCRNLLCFQGYEQKSYGINYEDKWVDDAYLFEYDNAKRNIKKATPAEVEAALEKECIRRYGEDWKNVKIEAHAANRIITPKANTKTFHCIFYNTDEIWNKNGCLFYKGKWADILPAKEQSNENIKDTVASLEKQLEELKRQIG